MASETFDLDNIRSIIYNRLPETMRDNSRALKVIDVLLKNNSNELFEEEEAITLFVDKFFTGMTTIELSDVTTPEYAYACKYVSYKMLGMTPKMAFELTYPSKASLAATRHQGDAYDVYMHRRGLMFEKSVLVVKVMDFSSIPIYVANAPLVQQSIDKLQKLMNGAMSEKIQMESAIALLKELKKPESLLVKHEHKVEVDTDSILDKFKKANQLIAATTGKALSDGDTSITDVDVIFKEQVSHNMNED